MHQHAKLAEGGRLLLPAAVRRAMGVGPGDTVVPELVGDDLRVRSYAAVVRRIQDRFRHLRPANGGRISDELIAERRAEAARE